MEATGFARCEAFTGRRAEGLDIGFLMAVFLTTFFAALAIH
jgi:tetrahydromethanopterin S-methyltransferase subunit F